MRRILIRVVLFLIVIAGIAFGVLHWSAHREQVVGGKIVLHGNVDIREVNLAFNASERIETMRVEEGDRVTAGQILATLDASELAHHVSQAQARVAAQAYLVARLEAGSREEEIKKARADLNAATVAARNAALAYERVLELRADGAATQQDLDSATAAAYAAEAQAESARESLRLLIAGPRKEDIASARATLDALRAELALAKDRIAEASLFAPAAGVVRTRLLEPGDMASPARPVYTLALPDPVWVRVYIEEPDLGKVWPGMKAEVTTDSYPGKRYPAQIGYISPTAEFTPKALETREVRTHLVYLAHAHVSNPSNELRLGMPATVIIPLDPQPEVASKPNGSPDDKKAFVSGPAEP